MKYMSSEDLTNIQGGFNLSNSLIIGGIITFLIGFLDGYIRPLSCNAK